MQVQRFSWLVLLSVLVASCLPAILEHQYVGTGLAVNEGLAVFWDEDCTEDVDFIEWGTLLLGSTRHVELYVWSRVDEPVFLYLETENWVPLNAEGCIRVELRGNLRSIKPDEVSRITIILHVSVQLCNITSFGFDIILVSLPYPLADLNKDRRVDMRDVVITVKAYGSYSGHPNWNPSADLNKDGKVCFLDVTAVAKEYGAL